MEQTIHQVVHHLVNSYQLSTADLTAASADLSQAYRDHQPHTALQDFRSMAAYLTVRLPATYGVVQQVLKSIPPNAVQTILDLGSGPGTAVWAALQHFTNITHATMVEHYPLMIEASQILAKIAPSAIRLNWQHDTINDALILKPVDLVIMSYALGEIESTRRASLLQKTYGASTAYIVLIEPGTPQGFQVIKKARQILLQLGAFTLAPCTHDQPCPLTSDDWCHFSERITRSNAHRHLKKAVLNYEDEKYSYVIMSKIQLPDTKNQRVIKPPLKRSGHIRLDLCDQKGIIKSTFSKRHKPLFHKARAAFWGSLWHDIGNEDHDNT